MGLAGLNPLVETYVKEAEMEEDVHAEGMHDKEEKKEGQTEAEAKQAQL